MQIYVPPEILFLIALYLTFPKQYQLFTRLNKELKRRYEAVVIPELINLSLSRSSFLNHRPNSILFENVLDVTNQENMQMVQYLFSKLARNKAEFYFRYYDNATPTLQILPSFDLKMYQNIATSLKQAWARRFDHSFPFLVFASRREQRFGIVKYLAKQTIWHYFTFPRIHLKPLAGIAYWFSFLIETSDTFEIAVGVKEKNAIIEEKRTFKNYNQWPIPIGFREINLKQGTVLTVALDFSKPPYGNLHKLHMKLKIYIDLKLIDESAPTLVSASNLYHPICALNNTATVIFRMDGIKFKPHFLEKK